MIGWPKPMLLSSSLIASPPPCLMHAPTQTLQGHVRVSWRLIDTYTLSILAAREVVSILRVKFTVSFFPWGLYKFSWLLISLARFDHKNSIWGDREITQHVCLTCFTIFKGWSQHLQPLGPTTWWWFCGSIFSLSHLQTCRVIMPMINPVLSHMNELWMKNYYHNT